MEELQHLTDAEFGMLIRCLYSSSIPEGSLRTAYVLLKHEYDRVNEYAEIARESRKERSKKAAEARWSSKDQDAKACLSIPKAMLKDANVMLTDANTSIYNNNNNKIKIPLIVKENKEEELYKELFYQD